MSGMQMENLTKEQREIVIQNEIIRLGTVMARLQKVVFDGDVELPLVERMRNMESFLKEFRYWTRFVFGALILQTLAFAGGVIVAIVRFLPLMEQLANRP